MEREELLISVLGVSLVFAVVYVIAVFVFFGKAGILVAGYNFEPKAPEAKALHGKIMRRIGVGLFVLSLFIHATILAFLFGENVAGGVLAGVSVAVTACVLVLLNTGKMKRWTREERRLEDEYLLSQTEKRKRGDNQ